MIEAVITYFSFIFSFLFCFVLSKFEQKKRNSKIAGSVVFYCLLVGLYKRMSSDAGIIAENFNISHLLAVACLLAIFISLLFLAKKLLVRFFGEFLAVGISHK